MYILGINISHDTSFCLLKDGEVITYVQEERLSKIKYCSIYKDGPILSLEVIKRYTNKLDYVVISSLGLQNDHDLIKYIEFVLDAFAFEVENIRYHPERHLHHAAAAFYNSGFNDAVSLVISGAGQKYKKEDYSSDYSDLREIESIYDCSYKDGINQKFKHYSTRNLLNNKEKEYLKDKNILLSSSLGSGWLFDVVSNCLGYCGQSVEKIVDLSSYGNSKNYPESWFYYDKESDHYIYNNNFFIKDLEKHITKENLLRQNYKNHHEIAPIPIMPIGANLVKKLQEQTKDQTIKLIEKAIKLTGKTNVVLSGEYFLNCFNNYEYIKRFPELKIYIEPISNDVGTSIGVAKFFWYHLTDDKTIRKQNCLYYGEDRIA